jgi:hypothetical protein
VCPLLGNSTVNVSAATNERATVEEPLEAVSSMQFMPRLYNEDDFALESEVSSLELHC